MISDQIFEEERIKHWDRSQEFLPLSFRNIEEEVEEIEKEDDFSLSKKDAIFGLVVRMKLIDRLRYLFSQSDSSHSTKLICLSIIERCCFHSTSISTSVFEVFYFF